MVCVRAALKLAFIDWKILFKDVQILQTVEGESSDDARDLLFILHRCQDRFIMLMGRSEEALNHSWASDSQTMP